MVEFRRNRQVTMPKLRGDSPIIRPPQAARAALAKLTPTYFLVYSTAEPQIKFFAECLEIVFGNHFRLIKTPGDLVSDKSQHDVIMDLIDQCAFGVVCLDGLRPNVVFEYGILRGAKKPVLLFKEEAATVDVEHFYGGAKLGVGPPKIDVDKFFSDTKDKFHLSWNRFAIRDTIKLIWDEYRKKKDDIKGYVDIPKPTDYNDIRIRNL